MRPIDVRSIFIRQVSSKIRRKKEIGDLDLRDGLFLEGLTRGKVCTRTLKDRVELVSYVRWHTAFERPSQDGGGDVSSGVALLKAPPLMHDGLFIIYNA